MKRSMLPITLAAMLLLTMPGMGTADVLDTAVRETILRLKTEQPQEVLLSLDSASLVPLLTEAERKTYSEQHLTFQVDVPVTVYLALEIFEFGLMVAWVFATVYIIALGVTFYIRFLGGKWKAMRVIELEPQVPKIRPTKLGRVAKL